MARILITAVVLFILWLLLSGHFEPLLMTLGAASCIAVASLAAHLGVTHRNEHSIRFALRLPFYLPWLVGEIVKSNLDVTRRIWHPRLPISPTVVRVRASQRTDLGIAVHANSITLTPGTLSIEAEQGAIAVHALSEDIAVQLADGEMDRRVRALEGGD